jgi:glycosyltransferase involved in cell wall biosynthesis
LLIAGASDRDESRIERAIDDQRLGERVRRLGYVPFQHLPAIYRRARVLANVSLWEGFGLPVLEAMACQVPVVASDIPSHHEVAAEGAFYVDAERADSIARGIERVWEDEPLRKSLIAETQKRLALFSWDETARRTLALYERLGPR